MNKLFFDLSVCQPNRESKFHGGGIYGTIVFKKLAMLASDNLFAYYFSSKFIEPSILELIKQLHICLYDGDQISLEKAYAMSGADLFYTPLYSFRHKALIEMGVKFVVTIHGLRSIEMLTDSMECAYATSFYMWLKAKSKSTFMKDRIYRRNYNIYKFLLDSANVNVVTVSNHSKYSILCYYPQAKSRNIDVFYSPSTALPDYNKYKFISKEKYYLIISANRWLKNAGRAIAAFDLLFDSNPNICQNVKVLGLKRNTSIYKTIKHKDKFELLGYQTQDELEKLYAGAYAFIYPTLNEGFGYPPLESMKYGVPVVSSPFSSIPEVCSDAVLYANPYSVEEIANRILQLEQRDLYDLYQKKGKERFQYIYEKQTSDLEKLCKMLISM